ncbi:MAG: hypothetical protein EOO72_00490 [Myxococcaceae bacterium]|nr:MAG: hypothetical protein EOO72_00490 [Myxococcaceae bacterium]
MLHQSHTAASRRALPSRRIHLVLLCLLGAQLTACDPEPVRDCVDGASETSACGLNGRGVQQRTCATGRWSEYTPCEDPDVCVDGALDSLSCGLNGRGVQQRTCEAGGWSAPGFCVDSDVCVDGSEESMACGLNGRGTGSRTCASGAWGEPRCEDLDVCIDGDVETSGCGILGSRSRECTSGQWGPQGDCDAPASIALQVPGRTDLVHDARRNRLYITTRDGAGHVRVFNLKTREFEAPLLTGGAFRGIDLSPDGDKLIVAEGGFSATHNGVQLIDLTTGASRRIEFTLERSEAGTFTAVFTSNTEALVSSNFNGSGWVPLRKVDLSNDTAAKLASVRQSTMLTASADGSTVAYAESNISSGEWGRFSVGAQTFAESSTGWFAYEVAVSRNASQYALPTYGGLFVFDSTLKSPTRVGSYANELPIGAVYSPVTDELYLAWTGAKTSIDVYSTTTLSKLRDIETAPSLFSWNGNAAFVNGRMRISRDGSLLFVTTGADGVRIYLTGP